VRLLRFFGQAVALGLAIMAVSVVVPGRPPSAPPSPPALPGPANHLSAAQAIRDARGPSKGTAAAREMSYGLAAALMGAGTDPAIDPGARVWLVTISGPTTFTVIVSGTDGSIVDACIGCRTL
jgi:hypothetical protein